MRYIRLFESYTSLTLYHGTVTKFDRFNDRITFFSSTPKFAEKYAITKSADGGLDADITIIEADFNGKLFDANNKVDYNIIKSKLPDEITAYHHMGGEFTISKDELLLNLTGVYTNHASEELDNKNIGDTFKFKNDDVYVLDKTNDKINLIGKSHIDSAIRNGMSNDIFKSTKEYTDIFSEHRQFITNVVMKITGKKKYELENSYINQFWYYKKDIIPTEDKEKESELYNKAVNKIISLLKEQGYGKWYVLKTTIEKLKNNWYYYENPTIINILHELDYDGYVAIEEGVKTYAIFEPNKTVKIIDTY